MGKTFILLLGLFSPTFSFAASDTNKAGDEQVPMSEDEVIPGVSAPQIKGLNEDTNITILSPEQQKARMEKAAIEGARELGVPVPFVEGVQEGMELLFLRNYA